MCRKERIKGGDSIRTIETGSGLVISWIPQDSSFLVGSLERFAEQNQLEESLFKAMLRKMGLERTEFEKNMEELSEGQKKKILLAKSLCEKAHLYVWDEPLNYIDIYSRMQIEQMILQCEPTMLFVEHDERFAEKTATKIVSISD